MASVEWSKSAVGFWGLNDDFENTLKISLCCGKKWLSGHSQTHRFSGSQMAVDEDSYHTHPCKILALHTHVRGSARLSLGTFACTRCSPGPERGCAACLFPKITSPCIGRPWKSNSFPATRQKQSLFHHRKGENILTNACVLDGWQSCHGKEAAAPFGDGRWGVGSGNFWALLAAQVWRRATNPPLLAADQCLNTSRLTPNARWLLRGSYETNLVFGDLSLLEKLHNPYSPP